MEETVIMKLFYQQESVLSLAFTGVLVDGRLPSGSSIENTHHKLYMFTYLSFKS